MAVQFNDEFFKDILTSQGVQDLCYMQAQAVLEVASANAPVDTGAYRDGLKIIRKRANHRWVFLVVGTDWKTLLVESWTGNLARAVKAVTRK